MNSNDSVSLSIEISMQPGQQPGECPVPIKPPSANGYGGRRGYWRRGHRLKTDIVIAVVVTLILTYLLAKVPITSKPFVVTIQTDLGGDVGVGYLGVPTGAAITASWRTLNNTREWLIISYSSGSYAESLVSNLSTGKFSFSSPPITWNYVVGAAGSLYVDVTSSSNTTVTITGSYTAPLI